MRVKENLKKIIAIISICMTCSFMMPNYSQAIDSKLAKPLQSFVCFIGDALLNGMQNFFLGERAVNKTLSDLNIKYSVANIVSNNIPILDINFFSDGRKVEGTTDISDVVNLKKIKEDLKDDLRKTINKYNNREIEWDSFVDKMDQIFYSNEYEGNYSFRTSLEAINVHKDTKWVDQAWKEIYNEDYTKTDFYNLFFTENYGDYIITGQSSIEYLLNGGTDNSNEDSVRNNFISKYYNEETDTFDTDKWVGIITKFDPVLDKISELTAETKEKNSSVTVLKPIVQKWYNAFRNLALVALLSILVYIGIKIVLSSTNNEKAKYKKLLTNWITAIVMVFMLHYMMAFVQRIVVEINTVISENVVSEDGHDILMEEIRRDAEGKDSDEDATGENEEKDYTSNMVNSMLYLILIIFTLKFTWIYLKRVVHMTFLTIIAPLVAVTYPLDKEKDGKSQAFDMWSKEYFFNAVLQPIHLMLYYVLVSSANALANNPIYSIVIIGFMTEAEKIIRKMFNIEKAGDASSLSSFAGGAITSSVLSRLAGHQKAMPSGNNGSGEPGGDAPSDNGGIKMAKIDDVFVADGSVNNNNDINIKENVNENTEVNIEGDNGLNNKGGNTRVENNISVEGQNGTKPGEITVQGQNGKITVDGKDTTTKVPDLEKIEKAQKQKIQENEKRLEDKQRYADKKRKELKRRQERNQASTASRVFRGVRAVGANTFKPANAKSAIRTVASVTGGVVGGTIGFGAAVTTGDVGKVAQGVALGAGVGAGAVNATINAGEKLTGTARDALKNTKDTYQKAYYDDEKEYQEKVLIPRVQKKNEKDKKIIEKYKKAGFGDWEKAMKSTTRDELYKNGIANEDVIIPALKAKQKYGMSDKELVQDVVISSKIKTYKDAQVMEGQLKQLIMTSEGLNEEQAEKQAKTRMVHIKSIAGL